MKLYLDGCSLTYGQGLDRQHSLGSLFEQVGGYEVLDRSRPGKSNMAIAMDSYQYRDAADVFVIGMTFSGRFGLQYKDQQLNFFPGFKNNSFGLEPMSLDQAHIEVQKYFFTVFDRCYYDCLSDMLLDSIANFLPKNKRIIIFSWETRTADTPVHYPFVPPTERFDDGHLNATGTRRLYDFLQSHCQ